MVLGTIFIIPTQKKKKIYIYILYMDGDKPLYNKTIISCLESCPTHLLYG